QNVQSFSADQVRSWYAEQVLKGRRVLAIYGDVDLEQAKALASHYLGSGEATKSQTSSPAAAQNPSRLNHPSIEVQRVEVQKTEQPLAGMVIGFDSRSVI